MDRNELPGRAIELGLRGGRILGPTLGRILLRRSMLAALVPTPAFPP